MKDTIEKIKYDETGLSYDKSNWTDVKYVVESYTPDGYPNGGYLCHDDDELFAARNLMKKEVKPYPGDNRNVRVYKVIHDVLGDKYYPSVIEDWRR